MHKYKFISICLMICLVFMGFTYREAEENAELTRTQNFLQKTDAVPDKLFFEEDIPGIVGFETATAEQYTKRLREDEQSLNEVIFRNTKGVNTQYLYAFPVKYEADGVIKDKTLKIASTREAGKTIYRSEDNDVVTTFSEDLSDGIRLQYKDTVLVLKPETQLPFSEAASDQKSVSYSRDSALTRNVSLTYMGFSEEIVMQRADVQDEFAARLYTNGLELYQNDFGQLLLRNAENETVAYVSDAVAFTADDRNNRLLSYTFDTVVPQEEYILRLALPEEYLADANTVYPLSLSSSIEINTSGAIEDVTINSNAGSSGTSGSLYIGKRSSFGISRTLMKFPGLNLSGISAGQISSASLEIRDLLCESQAMTVRCHAFTGNTWSENSASWSSVSPNSYASIYSSRSVSYGNGNAPGDSQRYAFDITSVVRNWASGSYDKNKGVIFKAEDAVESGSTYRNKTFASFNNSSYKPCLKLEYSSITPTVTFNVREVTVLMGNSKQLEYTRTPPNVGAISWVSSNYSALSISATGLVTPYFPGRYSVSILLYYNGIYVSSDICYITVLPQQSVSSGVYKIQNKYSGKYLTSKPNASVGLESSLPVGLDGSQLWFVENYGSFCVFYSLGLRDSSSLGAQEMVLISNTSGALLLYNETSNIKKWIISQDSPGVYYIAQYELVNKGLRSNDASDTPVLDMILHRNESEKWNLIPIITDTFNNYYDGSIGQGSRLYVKIEIDSSAYKNGYFTLNDFNAACSQWRGLTPRVVIYGPTESVPSDITPYVITIKGSEDDHIFREGVVAFFEPHLGDDYTHIWENFDNGNIYLYVRSGGSFSDSDANGRQNVITHELGHAFKLAHPHECNHLASVANARGGYLAQGNVASVMNQGNIYEHDSNACLSPTTYDLINFRNKWRY